VPTESLERAHYERALAAAGLSEVRVFHRRSTGSTNDDARALVGTDRFDPAAPATLIVAETQTRGRGRGGNSWSSPEGSIAMTLVGPSVDAHRLMVLPLGVGAAVVAAVRALGARASVKWPNDVLIEDRKVCGILCESSLGEGLARVFIGIGVNVSAGATDAKVAARATTLAAEGIRVERPTLVADIARRVVDFLSTSESASETVRRWKELSAPWWGEEVTLLEGTMRQRVTLLDVGPEGQLIVRDRNGVVRPLVSGEVRRVRPVTT
jgi:BirA family biotin operon repressor/biotin-[acetyl-CoA-carboxylase] ligase